MTSNVKLLSIIVILTLIFFEASRRFTQRIRARNLIVIYHNWILHNATTERRGPREFQLRLPHIRLPDELAAIHKKNKHRLNISDEREKTHPSTKYSPPVMYVA